MKHRIAAAWHTLAGSLWFVPALVTAGFAALALIVIKASDLLTAEQLERYPRLFGADAESSRSMLSTIAASIITVAGVTFSITVVAVSQASSQYTPRILRNFLRDRPSQLALGVLVGVFLYCLIVLRTIRGGDEGVRFVPSIAVLGAFALAMLALACLMYFIHHIASTLEAGSIIARVSEETVEAVEKLFPEELGRGPEQDETLALGPTAAQRPWFPVPARFTGYLQQVDEEGLMRLAVGRSCLIRMERGIGDFVTRGMALASVADRAPHDGFADELSKRFTAHSYRTVHQDADFGIRQIVDIALKALSPGVNDTTTAITCMDYIGAVLIELAGRAIPSPYRVRDGVLRVIARGPTFAGLLDTALEEIRGSAACNARVLERMLAVLHEVACATESPHRRALLRQHGERIMHNAEHAIALAEERRPIAEAFARLERTLDSATVVTAARTDGRQPA